MSECSRCRTALGNSRRWNHAFSGWAHWACPAPKVWPPQAQHQQSTLNVLRQLYQAEELLGEEAQMYLQKLVDILVDAQREKRLEAAASLPEPNLHETFTGPVEEKLVESSTHAVSSTSSSTSRDSLSCLPVEQHKPQQHKPQQHGDGRKEFLFNPFNSFPRAEDPVSSQEFVENGEKAKQVHRWASPNTEFSFVDVEWCMLHQPRRKKKKASVSKEPQESEAPLQEAVAAVPVSKEATPPKKKRRRRGRHTPVNSAGNSPAAGAGRGKERA